MRMKIFVRSERRKILEVSKGLYLLQIKAID